MSASALPPSPTSEARHRNALQKLYHGETRIDFIGRWKVWFAVSGLVILAGLAALGVNGLNLGIDFKGGNVWQTPAGRSTVADVRSAMEKDGLRDVRVQKLTGGSAGSQFRIQAETLSGTDSQVQTKRDQVATDLARVTGSRAAEVTLNEVGPSWGKQISDKARNALIAFLIVITLYITLRFEFKMAIATLAALVHDLLVVVGVYAIIGLPVTPATVIAILTILGFSIYDGIVVFDRVDENTALLSATARTTYSEMTNLSLNQVLMRSLNTSITALLPILSVLVIGAFVLGATTLEEFGLALFIGLLSGAYSSIFIASPVLALLKEREPRYKALRKRIAERAALGGPTERVDAGGGLASGGSGAPGRQPAVVGAASRPAGGASVGTATGQPRTYSANHPPRPRKKGKKR
jgi:preprotein translocase subunit SecF